MAIAISDLVKPLTPEDVLADLIATAKQLGMNTTAWAPGDPAYNLLSIMAEQLSAYWNDPILNAISAGFLDYASGDWLTLLAITNFNVLRKEAIFTGDTLTLANQDGGFYVFSPGDVRVKNGVTNKTFTNVTGGTLAAVVGATLDLDFQADEAGSGSDTAIGEIDATLVSGPSGVICQTNTNPIVGQDEESDDSLKARCRLATGPLSPGGAKAAYEYVALSTTRSDGTYVDVNRVRVRDAGGGIVNVWLASPTGPATGDINTPGTDVFLVNQALQLNVVPVGITCNVAAAVPHSVTFSITIYVDRAANVTVAEAETAANAALDSFFSTLPIGGTTKTAGGPYAVFASEVAAKASEAVKGVIKAEITGSDVLLAENQVAVPTVTVTAELVTQ